VLGGVLAPGGAESGTVASFEIGRTEVTVAAYRKCVESGACAVPGPYFEHGEPLWPECRERIELECNFSKNDREDHPINCVTARQAESYCVWRGQRLPTSAEWEMAARGSEGRAFPWGDRSWLPERANLCDRQCVKTFRCPFGPVSTKLDDGFASSAPVGSYSAGKTPSGIADLLGNVSEFTSTVGRGDGNNTAGTTGTLVRGGSWATWATVSFRAQLTERDASPSVGFRCARDAQPERE
jgi:formylglycine-generating enzyme required for sulfatase activity